MLQFYTDPNLQYPITLGTPKRVLFPLWGGNKYTTIYLGDGYQTILSANASSGATTLDVNDTSEFLSAGTACVNPGGSQIEITYTGKTGGTLTGVSGLSANVTSGMIVKPWKVYKSNGNMSVGSLTGSTDLSFQILLSSDGTNYAFPGQTLILTGTSYDNTMSPVAVYVNMQLDAGAQQVYNSWTISFSQLYIKDKNDSSSVDTSTVSQTAICFGYMFRRDQSLGSYLRLLSANRAIQTNAPGFVMGEYKWRDSSLINAQILAPATRDQNPTIIGYQNFGSGIGNINDLEPIEAQTQENSIFLNVNVGYYFIGPERFHIPDFTEFQIVSGGNTTIQLPDAPLPTQHVFVGNWYIDSKGYYWKNVVYRYKPQGFISLPGNSTYQYTLNRQNNQVQTNIALPDQTYYLGTLSGEATDYFQTPIWPIYNISAVYVNPGYGVAIIPATFFDYNQETGVLSITNSSGTPSVAGALAQQPVYMTCTPGLAVYYNTNKNNSYLIDTVDLNPAFSGIANGYVYIQHRARTVSSIVLTADKPIIDIPATNATIVPLVAYGPVYYDGDYALLTAQVLDDSGSPMAGVSLSLILSSIFEGLINYEDPLTTTITLVTGADGKVGFIYTPTSSYGYFIPMIAAAGGLGGLATTSITNDTIVLPAPVPIGEIYTPQEGWLVDTYLVMNNNPLYGMSGANTLEGEIPYTTYGTAGSTTYTSNGQKVLWKVSGIQVVPINAYDSSGYSYTNGSFSGNVSKIQYSLALPSTTGVACYFVTFVDRVTIQVQAEESDVLSNTILLQMAVPSIINDDPWWTVQDVTNGVINSFRLDGNNIDL